MGFDPGIEELRMLVRETGAYQYSPEKKFRLVSGESSSYYFDLKLLTGDPRGLSAAARALYGMVQGMPGIKSVGGLVAGSIPLAAAVSQLSYIEHERDSSCPLLGSFFVRKEAKDHGTGKRIEGLAASPVIVIDDVVTSGMSALSAVEAVRGAGVECSAVACVIFRGTDAQRHTIEEKVPLRHIFCGDEFTGLDA